MSNELNKTEADFVYERYRKMDNPPPEQSIPIDDLHPNDQTPDRSVIVLTSPAPERDDLLESDAVLAADAAGLTDNVIDYAEDEELLEEEALPLEDIPDADEIAPGSAIDPASPPVDVMPGTDVINGSHGE